MKIDELEDELAKSKHKLEEIEQKLQRNLSSSRQENFESVEKYQANISSFQKEIQNYNKEIGAKNSIIRNLVDDKDKLHLILDEKTLQIEDLKSKLLSSENKRVEFESENSGQLRRVSDCLQEIKELQQKTRIYESKIEQLQTRILGEQEVSKELRDYS